MAKKSMIEREKKRQRLVDKYAQKREDLKEQFSQAETLDDKIEIHRQLQQLSPPPAQPLLAEWTPQRLLSGLWPFPPRHSRNGPQRVAPGRCQVQLVVGMQGFWILDFGLGI